jgi:UMP-CMP kinase
MEDKDFIFVLGGPGSGKGTQAQRIAKEYDIGYLSAGDLLRAAANLAKDPPKDFDPHLLKVYMEISDIIKNGKLVPAHVICKLLRDAIIKGSQKHWLIDGFPRDMSQTTEFVESGKDCVALLYIDVPDEELIKRLLNRGKTSGRVDDNIESIKKRLVTHYEQTVDVVTNYEKQDKVIKIDGNREIEIVHNDIVAKIKEIWTDLPEPK